MELQKIFQSDEERAVSPVIGVILMVAITVILAAVIATFVLGLGDTQNSAPQVSFDFNETSNGYEVIHAGGDPFDAGNVDVGDGSWTDGSASDGDTVTAGDTASSSGFSSGDRIVWNDPESDSSAVIGEIP